METADYDTSFLSLLRAIVCDGACFFIPSPSTSLPGMLALPDASYKLFREAVTEAVWTFRSQRLHPSQAEWKSLTKEVDAIYETHSNSEHSIPRFSCINCTEHENTHQKHEAVLQPTTADSLIKSGRLSIGMVLRHYNSHRLSQFTVAEWTTDKILADYGNYYGCISGYTLVETV